jgi:hypothetical protein
MSISRAAIIGAARSFIDTAFEHRGRSPGVGLDCAGVLVCAARLVGAVPESFDVPEYGPVPDGRLMLEWCREYLGAERTQDSMRPGDVLVVRTAQHPQHLALLADYHSEPGVLSIIHASNTPLHRKVLEQRLVFSRKQAFVAAFEFPGVALDG